MKTQRSLLVAAVVLAGGCFDDPTSSLRDGAMLLNLSRSAVVIVTDDSTEVTARLLDGQGNTLPSEGIEWQSADGSVATVAVAALVTPGGPLQRAFIKGVTVDGGITEVTATVRGVSNTVRVVVVPEFAPAGFFAQSGTAVADTTAGGVAFTASDTVVFNATSNLEFDDAESDVLFGTNPGYIISRTATQIKAMARSAHSGRVAVTNVRFLGNAETGEIVLGEVKSADVNVAQPRFRGTATISGGILATVDAPAGTTFDAATSNVVFIDATGAATTGTVINRTTTQIQVSSAADCAGCALKVTNVTVPAGGGNVTLDSLRWTNGVSISRATFPGTVTTNGTLLGVVTITPTGGATLATGGSPSVVTIGGLPALVASQSATLMEVVPQTGSTGPISITNVTVGGVLFPTLNTPGNVVISGTTTGEANELANDLPSGAPTLSITGTFQNAFGAVQSNGANPFSTPGADFDDHFKVIIAAPTKIHIVLDFIGTGAGGSTGGNPDIDLFLVKDDDGDDDVFGDGEFCDEFGGTFVETTCAGVTADQPEVEISDTLPAGTYYILVELFRTGGVTAPIVYRLQYRTEP